MLKRVVSLSVFLPFAVAAPVIAATGPEQIHKCTTITAPGSYVLADNLTASGDCIVIAASHVSLDLAGFVIAGNGTGWAIRNSGIQQQDITVHDGTVTGFEGGIVFCSSWAPSGNSPRDILIYRVRATQNSKVGIEACDGSATVRDSIVNENGTATSLAVGIDLGQFFGSNMIAGCAVNRNTGAGIIAFGRDSSVIGNTVSRNGTPTAPVCNPGPGFPQPCAGIWVDRGSTVSNNSVGNNAGWGIIGVCPMEILGNTVSDNRRGQISTAPGCNVEHNAQSTP